MTEEELNVEASKMALGARIIWSSTRRGTSLPDWNEASDDQKLQAMNTYSLIQETIRQAQEKVVRELIADAAAGLSGKLDEY